MSERLSQYMRQPWRVWLVSCTSCSWRVTVSSRSTEGQFPNCPCGAPVTALDVGDLEASDGE